MPQISVDALEAPPRQSLMLGGTLDERYAKLISAERVKQATLQRMQQDFVNSINAYALVLVLLASLTFAGNLQPPGGFDDEGHLHNYTTTTVYVYFNSVSFFCCVSDLLLCVGCSLSPLMDIRRERDDMMAYAGDNFPTLEAEQKRTTKLANFVASTLRKLILVNILFACSLTCCVAGFVAAGLAVMHPGRAQHISLVITSAIGCLSFLAFFLWLVTDTVNFWISALNDQSLSDCLTTRAGNQDVQMQYHVSGRDSSITS